MSYKLSRIHFIQKEQVEAEKVAEAGWCWCGAAIPLAEEGDPVY